MSGKVLLLDLDGTLTTHSTWEALNIRLGITPEEDQRLFTAYKKGNLDYKDWMVELMKLYKQNPPVTRKEIEIVAHSIKLRPDAQQAIDDAKAKGYRVIIISGGVDVMVSPIAAELGITEWLTSNKAIFNKQDELINIEDSGHERDSKLFLLQDFCLKNNYELSDVIEVADGGNDTELFKMTKGIMLGHNAELAPLAWKQIDNLSELNDLL